MTRANLLTGPSNTQAKPSKDLGTTIDPGTCKTLGESLGKANTGALIAALPRRQPSRKRRNTELTFSETQMHVEQAKRVLSFDRRLTRR